MEKRTLGRSGLQVTALGYGAMELRRLSVFDAGQLLNTVLDSGINYIDTSPDYGPSEDQIGATIAHRRDEYVLASKCGCNIDADGKGQTPPHLWTRAKLMENIETSLRRLRTDHLDVWQLHGPAPEELPGGAQDDVLRAMQELKQQGKVRFIGTSFRNGGSGDPLYPAGYGLQQLPTFLAWDVFDVMQIVYGGLTRLNEERIADAARANVGIIARGVVKKYQPDYPQRFDETLADLAAPGEDMNAFLIRFALSHPGISTMIIGTASATHLHENVTAAERGALPAEVYAEAQRRLAEVGIKPG
jgi:aryl-alcohol dehydrogenase-like predicted oxidoreductase